MKPNTKSPYEIRLELLQLAQVILSEQHKAKASGDPTDSAPTTEAIVKEAEKLNAFVSNTTPGAPQVLHG